jgi:ElaB/YqjD/DUF883 family membrane-anchored ribosome-binding protein
MSKNTRQFRNDVTALAEDARALLAATAHVAEDHVVSARQRLTAALEQGENLYHRVRDGAEAEAEATNRALHKHPYQAVGVAFGVGLLLGCFVACRWSRDGSGSRSGFGA